MFEEFLPSRKVGCLSPLAVIDNHAYEFYRLVPEKVMLVMVPLGLQEFSRDDVERVFAQIDRQVDRLVERGVDLIVQAGVPLPILVGTQFLDALLARIRERSGLPATSTVLNVVAAAKRLDIKRIAVANKWTNEMNRVLGEFFGRDGISIVGVTSKPMMPNEFVSMTSQDGIELAYGLGYQALRQYPEADGLYIGGGAWLTLPVVERLEREFGKPVVTNQVATVWHVLQLLDRWEPIPGFGRLLESA